jgi:hypothetical protein
VRLETVTTAAGNDISPRVLLIEDDEDDYVLTRELLADASAPPSSSSGCRHGTGRSA